MGSRNSTPWSDQLFATPWWLSVILAVASFVLLHEALPQVFGETPLQSALVTMLRGLAWLPAVFFAFAALIVYLREQKRLRGRDAARAWRPSSRMEDGDVIDVVALGAPGMQGTPDCDGGAPGARPPDAREWPGGPAALVSHAGRGLVRDWSAEALGGLDWQRFQALCVAYYEAVGFVVEAEPYGPEGGADAMLFRSGADLPIAIVQCRFGRSPASVEAIRALGGVMLERRVRRGVHWSADGYAGDRPFEYAERAGIQLLDAGAIAQRLRALDPGTQQRLLARTFPAQGTGIDG